MPADRQAAAVLVSAGRTPQVLISNPAAAALGIRPGLALGAAQALGDIEVYTRAPRAEHAALEALAAWCGQFTSYVSLAPPDGLLLEVGGSLTLFGGSARLMARLRTDGAELGYSATLAVAPTPLAAIWFARARVETCITDQGPLHGPLGRLPLAVLGLDARSLAALTGLGLRRIGECLQLPRDGLARRLGPGLLSMLDRALGHAPDPRPRFEPPARFRCLIDLPHEVDAAAALQFIARRQLLQLTGFLRGRGAGTRRLDWRLIHHEGRETRFHIALVAPSRDPEHLGQLLRLRLERLALPEPVRGIELEVADLCPLAATPLALLPASREQAGEPSWSLIERLRAQLGEEAVRGLRLAPDHRPESAWCFCLPGETGPVLVPRRRPLWLLAEPRVLTIRARRPWLQGPLQILGSGERIESGWWDGQPIARDYYPARNALGSQFWIFREIEGARRWFLHGVFE